MPFSDSDSFENCVSARSSFSQQCSLPGSVLLTDPVVGKAEAHESEGTALISSDVCGPLDGRHPGISETHYAPRHACGKHSGSDGAPETASPVEKASSASVGVLDMLCVYPYSCLTLEHRAKTCVKCRDDRAMPAYFNPM